MQLAALTIPETGPPVCTRKIDELGRELGITHVQAGRWNEFASALEVLQTGRRDLDERARVCAMDAPADMEAVIHMQVTWAQDRLGTLQLLMERTQSLCEVLTARQRQKANRLLQAFSGIA